MKKPILDKVPKNGRVVVAMSGGVDSSVTAALLAEEGYEVVGVTLQLYDHGASLHKKGACCAGQDIEDAAKVADKIGISHYVLNYENQFRDEVIDVFADSYIRGETPIPCVLCNQTVKFRDLLGVARDLGADALATGHYIRRVQGENGLGLFRAIDEKKDQSYFLFATTPDQLEFLRFPLGELTKEETRKLAERYELPVAAKPDSQDICFVPQGRYSDVVLKRRPDSAQVGDIVDIHGNVLGQHKGVIHYTVGQRRGLNLDSAGEALYVLKIEPYSKKLIVGPKEALKTKSITLSDVNWLGDKFLVGKKIECEVKVRSMRPPVAAALKMLEKSKAEVELAVSEIGISPGQACVFYEGARVLGGGWINRENSKLEFLGT